MWFQAVRDDALDLRRDIVPTNRLHVEAREKTLGGRDARLFVIDRADAPVEKCRCRRLAEIVADRAEHDRDLLRPLEIATLTRLIDDQERVHPDVALGMPFGFLRTTNERLEFGKQAADNAELERERKAGR